MKNYKSETVFNIFIIIAGAAFAALSLWYFITYPAIGDKITTVTGIVIGVMAIVYGILKIVRRLYEN